MRTLYTLFLLVAVGCSSPQTSSVSVGPTEAGPTARAAEVAPFSVVFYNVENLFDTHDDPGTGDDDFTPQGELRWTEERYSHKLHQLALAIGLADPRLPAVIGLCEVENRSVVEDLARTPPLDQAKYTVVHRDSPDERGIDVALLVDTERFTLGETAWLEVDLGHDRTRDILQATLELNGVGPFEVFVNHWPSRREGTDESDPKRMVAAEVVRGEVDRLLAHDPQARIIILGDLNDEPLDASLKRGLRTDDLVSDDRGADLYDLVGMDRTEPTGSISYNGQWQYFDHVIVSRSLVWPEAPNRLRAASAAAVKDARLIFRHPRYGDQPNRTFSGTKYHRDGYSDHLPVVLRLE